MLVALARTRRLRLPAGLGTYLLFLVFVAASAVMLNSRPPGTLPGQPEGPLFGYVFRAGSYVAALAVLLYLVNVDESVLPTRRVVNSLACLFVATVIGGYLGLLFPRFEYTSPLERLLPTSVRSNEYVQAMVHPGSAQVQDILGYPSARPKAPFEYTNQWGASFSLLLPFFVLALHSWRSRRARIAGWLVLAAGVPPVVRSLNRGLWIAVVVAALFGLVHVARSGRLGWVIGGTVLSGMVMVVVLMSPLSDVVYDRLRHPHSDAGRAHINRLAIDGARASPLLGWGGPRRPAGSPTSPSAGPSASCPKCGLPGIGTHGTLWLIAFSQGIVALGLFLTFLVSAAWRVLREKSDLDAAVGLVLILFLFQMILYNQLPTALVIAFAGVGLVWRRRRASWDPAHDASHQHVKA
jgi:hypothetical protein